MSNTLWCGSQADKLYLQSGEFTSTLKTSEDVSAIDTDPTDISFDRVNTPWCGNTDDKLYLQSGKFSSTLKTSLSIVAVNSIVTGISFDENGNTPWCGIAGGAGEIKLYLQSGQFSSTIKTSIDVDLINVPRGISFDYKNNTPWIGSNVDKLYLQSGQFTSTIKTSESITGIDTDAVAITWSPINTPWAGSIADKLYLQSGQFTSTLKTSQDISTIDTDIQGIDTDDTNARFGLFTGNQNLLYRYGAFDRVTRFFISPKFLTEGVHKIAVKVEDIVGNLSDALEVTETLNFFPDPVTSFAGTYNAGPKTVTLTWVDPTNSDLASIKIFDNAGGTDPAPDYDTIIASIAPGVQTFTTVALADGDFVFGIRAVDSVANQDLNVDVLVFINVPNVAIPFKIGFRSLIEDDLEDEPILFGVPLSSGKVKLEWEYFFDKTNATVTVFKIFTDNGTGTIDFVTPLDSVTRNSDTTVSLHTFTSSSLTTDFEKTFKFSIRAETAGGVSDGSIEFISVILKGQIPSVIENLVGSVVRKLDGSSGTE